MTWEGRVMSRCQMRRVWQRWWNKGRNWKKEGRNARSEGYRQTCVRIMGFVKERKTNKPSWHLDEWDRYNVNVCQTSNYHVHSLQNFKGLIQYLPLQSTVGPLIGRYCGTRVPPEIQSSTGILSLSFHTDMAVAKDGFSARYNMTHKEVSESKFNFLFYFEFF